MGRQAIKWELVYEGKLKVNKVFTKEKETYYYLRKELFKIAYKIYSPVLRGLPDFLVVETKYPEVLLAGFYEVKFKDYDFTELQKKFFLTFARAFNCYLIRVNEQGYFWVSLCKIDLS